MVGDTVSAVVSEIHDWNQNKKEKKNLKTQVTTFPRHILLTEPIFMRVTF